MSSTNGDRNDHHDIPISNHTGTFPVAVALHVTNLPKFMQNMENAVDDGKDGSLLMYFNRNDIKLSDSNGVIRITLTLD
jgi:hypothetical protein